MGIDPEGIPGQSSSVVIALFCWNFWGTTSPYGAKIEGGVLLRQRVGIGRKQLGRIAENFLGCDRRLTRGCAGVRVCGCAGVPGCGGSVRWIGGSVRWIGGSVRWIGGSVDPTILVSLIVRWQD